MRPFVKEMAEAMERKLQENDHRTEIWDDLAEVIWRLQEEVAELSKAALCRLWGERSEALLGEAADVANLAGMLARFVQPALLPPVAKKGAACDERLSGELDEARAALREIADYLEEVLKEIRKRNFIGFFQPMDMPVIQILDKHAEAIEKARSKKA